MRKNVFFALLFSITSFSHAQNTPVPTTEPVLIQLFTSQGCSSCPPAEQLLNTWGKQLFEAKKALPLAFHVDYWDNLGWPDPFSSSQYSDLQRNYAGFFQSDTVYTPQMIVQGQVGFNGADLNSAQRAVTQATLDHLPPLGLTVHGSNGIQIKVHIPTEILSQMNDYSVLEVVTFENGKVTSVERGENSGRTLTEDFVVRSMKSLGRTEMGATGDVSVNLSLIPGMRLSQSGMAVWVQDIRSMHIQGLEWVYPIVKN